MTRFAYLVMALGLGWVACWLVPGCWVGQPTLLLHPDAAPQALKLIYLISLYCWLLTATALCWRGWGPALSWSRPGLFWQGLALGAVALGVHRALLGLSGDWSPPSPHLRVVLIACLTSPLLAFAEEAVFRGYLFGVLREDRGRWPAYLGSSLLFSAVHLFRPGSPGYKLGLGLGLFLAGLVLCRLVEQTESIWAGVGLHTAWILAMVCDPPRPGSGGLWAGLEGDPTAGLLGWLLLLGLFWGLRRRHV